MIELGIFLTAKYAKGRLGLLLHFSTAKRDEMRERRLGLLLHFDRESGESSEFLFPLRRGYIGTGGLVIWGLLGWFYT